MSNRAGAGAFRLILLVFFAGAALGWTPLPASPHLPTDSTEEASTPTARGAHLTASYLADALTVFHGGERPGPSLLHNLLIEVSSSPSSGGLESYFSVLGNAGGSIGSRAGDVQGLSNIEAPTAWRVYEAWVDRGFAGARASLRVGMYDLNSEFYVTRSSGLFLNSSHGIGPEFGLTGEGGPSIFPFTALAARLSFRVRESVTVRAAALDGAPGAPDDPAAMGISLSGEEGALLVGEVEWMPPGDGGLRAVVGGWGYTAVFQPLDGWTGGERGNLGGYAVLERGVLPCADRTYCVTAFARVGLASPRFNVVSRAWGTGVVAHGSEGGWAAGVALAGAGGGHAHSDAASHEVNLEVTARVPISSRVVVLPDIQYVVDPGMSSLPDHVLAAGLRLEISF